MTATKPDYTAHPASYKDPSGFVFRSGDSWYRQVNTGYQDHYTQLMRSGLYRELTGQGLLIAHQEVEDNLTGRTDWYKTLLPLQLPFISYPDEWCPEQLKDAALLTLRVQKIAMEHGMSLKDATPLNIQFYQGKPLFVDTLSFEIYDPSLPWIAYRQFCECFLFPLFLQFHLQFGTSKIARAWPDGIPAALTARLLPLKSRWHLGAWMHVALQKNVRSDSRNSGRQPAFSKQKLGHLVDHLQSLVSRPAVAKKTASTWSNYYGETILGNAYLAEKEKLFRQHLAAMEFTSALDLGANDGHFSLILAESKRPVIAVDSDWLCIDNLYKHTRNKEVTNILPLCVDLADPTPASGFGNRERAGFTARSGADVVIALALVHHLSLGMNIPLPLIADYFGQLTQHNLIIEFVPLTDPKAQELIAAKRSTPPAYTIDDFESGFGTCFSIEKKTAIPGTERVLYSMKKHH